MDLLQFKAWVEDSADLDSWYWNKTLIGNAAFREKLDWFYELGLDLYRLARTIKPPFNGLIWRLFPIARWRSHAARVIHRTFFLYGLTLTKAWYKKKRAHNVKLLWLDPADVYVPEVFRLQYSNLTEIDETLGEIVRRINLPPGVADTYFHFDALSFGFTADHEHLLPEEDDPFFDPDEPVISPADYTDREFKTRFPDLYAQLGEDEKRMIEEEREIRREREKKAAKRRKKA